MHSYKPHLLTQPAEGAHSKLPIEFPQARTNTASLSNDRRSLFQQKREKMELEHDK
jgi:hypothetical protein